MYNYQQWRWSQTSQEHTFPTMSQWGLLMGDVESEQSQDDFEIETADIDELGAAANSSKPSRSSQQPRFPPRQRRLQLNITASIVVLAILLILGSTAPVRELVRSVFM